MYKALTLSQDSAKPLPLALTVVAVPILQRKQ